MNIKFTTTPAAAILKDANNGSSLAIQARAEAAEREITEGIILVTVPHQLPASAAWFGSHEDLMDYLRRIARPEFTHRVVTKAEYLDEIEEMQDDEKWMKRWAAKPLALFEQSEILVESGNDAGEWYLPSEAPTEFGALMNTTNDYHAYYTLDKEQALQVLAGTRAIHQHQQLKVKRAIREAAESLGWVATA